ncbi:MAG: right-handed parallel beta-helix repeat-containing protein [Verrucomicrobiota bacterium]
MHPSSLFICCIYLVCGHASGYTISTSSDANGPVFDWINIRSTGTEVVGGNTSTGKGEVEFEVPFPFYDEVVYHVAVSVEGYIDVNRSDSGTDLPGSNPGGRLYGYHADLEIASSPRGIYYQYFHDSPHPHYSGGVHVFQWDQVNHATGSSSFFSFQVLVFDHGDILMQYLNTPASVSTRTYTTGIQRSGTIDPLVPQPWPVAAYHNAPSDPDVAANLAILFEPPSILVTSSTDSITDPDNLRNAIRQSSQSETLTKIEFSPTLSGQTITLHKNLEPGCHFNDLECFDPPALIIDASGLPDGIAIHAQNLGATERTASMISSPNIGTHPPLQDQRFTPPYMLLNNLDVTGNDGRILAQDSPCSVVMTRCTFDGLTGGVVVFDDFTGDITFPVLGQVVMRDCEVTNCSGYLQGANDAVFSFEETMPSNFHTPVGISVHDTIFKDNTDTLFSESSIATGGGNGRAKVHVRDCQIDNLSKDFAILNTLQEVIISDSAFYSAGISSGSPLSVVVDMQRSFFAKKAYDSFGEANGGVTIDNCTFSGDERFFRLNGARPGALQDLLVTSSTFVRDAAMSSSVFHFSGNSGDTYNARFDNSIFTGGTVGSNHVTKEQSANPLSVPNLSATAFFASIFDRSEPLVSTSAGNTGIDPLLLPLAMNGGPTPTHLPASGSPAIEAGTTGGTTLAATDQRGVIRQIDFDGNGTANVDIGAVEVEPIFEVTTLVDESVNPGTGVSLREALNSSPPNATITFASNLDGGTIQLGSKLDVTSNIHIDASVKASVTVRGSPGFSLFDVADNVNIEVTALRMERGRRGIEGGFGNIVTLNNVQIHDMHIAGDVGAGILLFSNSTLVANFLEIGNCSALEGGGLYIFRSDITLNDCWIHHCSATAAGGGLVAWDSANHGPRLNRCAFTYNSAPTGGGIFKTAMPNDLTGFSLIKSCTFGENEGGAIYNEGGPLEVQFCTIHRNTGLGGVSGPDLTLTNYYQSILSGNISGSSLQNVTGGNSSGYNLEDGNSGILDQVTDIILSDAKLTPLGWHGGFSPTYALLANSPAINGGEQIWAFRSEFVENTPDYFGTLRDQRRFTRPRYATNYIDITNDQPTFGILPDIGAVEMFQPVIVTTSLDQNQNPAGSLVSLREAIRDCPFGGRILFDSSLDGSVSQLLSANNELDTGANAIMIDATGLSRGFRVRAGGGDRCLSIPFSAQISIHAVSFSDGSSNIGGGGIWNEGCLTLTRSAVYDCVASGVGGGIWHDGAFLHVENCTFSGNQAQGHGGGIGQSDDGTYRVRHCTIVNNSALGGGQGLSVGDGDLHVTHTAFESNGNQGDKVVEVVGSGETLSGGFNLEDAGGFDGSIASDIIGASAQFSTLADNGGYALSHLAQAGSPVLNASTSTLALIEADDQLGGSRVLNKFLDIGAVEHGGYFAWIRTQTSNPTLMPFNASTRKDGMPNGIDYLLTAFLSAGHTTSGPFYLMTYDHTIPDVDFTLETSRALDRWEAIYEWRSGMVVTDDWSASVSNNGNNRTLTLFDPDHATEHNGQARVHAKLR